MPSIKNYFKVKNTKAVPGREPDQTSTLLDSPLRPTDVEKEVYTADCDTLYPESDIPDPSDGLSNLKSDVIVNWIHSKQEEKIWTTGQPGEGVVLKKAKGHYVCCPSSLRDDGSQFAQMVAHLNVCVRIAVPFEPFIC
jgi:hypothetical protein